jgi:hypothetical protein
VPSVLKQLAIAIFETPTLPSGIKVYIVTTLVNNNIQSDFSQQQQQQITSFLKQETKKYSVVHLFLANNFDFFYFTIF